MTQPTYDELVTKLRAFETSDAIGDGDFSVCRETALLVEALVAENAELIEAYEEANTNYYLADLKCVTLAARVVQLEGALKRIAESTVTGSLWRGWAMGKAREALSTPSNANEVLLGMLEKAGDFDVYNGDSYIQIKPEHADSTSVTLYKIKE